MIRSVSTPGRCPPRLDRPERLAYEERREREANGCDAMSRAGEATAKAGNRDAPPEDGLGAQLIGMAAALWASRQRVKVGMLLVALVAVVGASALAQIMLNAWNRPFYDALARKDVSAFVVQLGVFAELAGVLLVLNVAQAWLNLMSKLVLRKGLVEDLTAV